MEIRALQKQDIGEALGLASSVFSQFVAPDYGEEGVRAFMDFIAPDAVTGKMDAGRMAFWGCYDGPVLAGVAATLDVSHICLLFVKNEYHRRGIAKRLVHEVAGRCQNAGRIEKLTVNASPYAAGIYRRMGFYAAAEEKTADGIRFTPMEYPLPRA